MNVRALEQKDVAALVAAFPEAEGTPANRHAERWQLQLAGEVTALTAWDGDVPVGYCVVRWLGGRECTAHAIELGCSELADVFVSRSARRRGVGRSLVEAAEQLARDRGVDSLGLEVTVANAENAAARRLYGQLGYHPSRFGEFLSGYTYWTGDGVECRDEELCWYLVKQLRRH